jgi:AGZA family xanthine/uracil permease-like MFS transporter
MSEAGAGRQGNAEVTSPSLLDRWFKLSERDTTLRTELVAGLTTFMTMAYIIFVNPQILSDAGIPVEAAFGATIYASVIATTLMGLWANFPIATAPGMGLNAFFAYTVVQGQGLSWQTALGAVFISGIAFFILTVTGIRELMIDGVPAVLRSAIAVGIGLFIAFIGLKNAGIVVSDETNFVALGNLVSAGPLLALLGLLVASFLLARGVKGAFIFSILITTVVSMIVGFSTAPSRVGDVFTFSLPDMSETFLAMDIGGALAYGLLSVLFTFTVVEVFDNLATFIGLTRRAGLMDENGKIPNINRAFAADAVGTLSSASLGSTAMNAYIENATGIEEGGRTGIQALVVAFLFLLALLFAPFVGLIPAQATAPVLVLVGALMLSEIRHIRFVDYTDVIPAFLTMFMMPLTFSIAEGLAFGFVSYTLLKLLTGKAKQIHWITYIISAAFLINFWLLGR